jgi:hypothetical protein
VKKTWNRINRIGEKLANNIEKLNNINNSRNVAEVKKKKNINTSRGLSIGCFCGAIAGAATGNITLSSVAIATSGISFALLYSVEETKDEIEKYEREFDEAASKNIVFKQLLVREMLSAKELNPTGGFTLLNPVSFDGIAQVVSCDKNGNLEGSIINSGEKNSDNERFIASKDEGGNLTSIEFEDDILDYI